MFKLESELPRTPNAFNAETYELSPLHFRSLGPGEEAMGPAVRKTGGCWSLEKSLRNKLREELRLTDKDRDGNVVPGVDVVMEIGEDPQQESDRFDKEWCRHILGRSELGWAGGFVGWAGGAIPLPPLDYFWEVGCGHFCFGLLLFLIKKKEAQQMTPGTHPPLYGAACFFTHTHTLSFPI